MKHPINLFAIKCAVSGRLPPLCPIRDTAAPIDILAQLDNDWNYFS